MKNWQHLSEQAWKVRDRAVLAAGGKTKVGCVVVDDQGNLGIGCNIQHVFRCDLHAEVVALGNLKALGGGRAVCVFIAAERERFTPCGPCVGWIMELGGPDCIVAFQSSPTATVQTYKACDLMPHYPA
jgi:cytidine deaminase